MDEEDNPSCVTRLQHDLPCAAKCQDVLHFTLQQKCKQKSFNDVLNSIPKEDIGDVNENWFDDLTAERLAATSTPRCKTASIRSPFTPQTSQHHGKIDSSQDPWVTPSLYGFQGTPSSQQHINTVKYRSNRSPSHKPEIITSTPIIVNKEAEDQDDSFQFNLLSTQDLLCNESPLPRCGKICMDDLDLAEQTPWDGLREKLGLDFEESNVSWTTSMATPPTNPSTDAVTNVVGQGARKNDTSLHMGAARSLFSPLVANSSQDFLRISRIENQLPENIKNMNLQPRRKITETCKTPEVDISFENKDDGLVMSDLHPIKSTYPVDFEVGDKTLCGIGESCLSKMLLEEPEIPGLDSVRREEINVMNILRVNMKSEEHRNNQLGISSPVHKDETIIPDTRTVNSTNAIEHCAFSDDKSITTDQKEADLDVMIPVKEPMVTSPDEDLPLIDAGKTETDNEVSGNIGSSVVHEAFSIFDSPPFSHSIKTKKAPSKKKAKTVTKSSSTHVLSQEKLDVDDTLGNIANLMEETDRESFYPVTDHADIVKVDHKYEEDRDDKTDNILCNQNILIKNCLVSCQTLNDSEISFKLQDSSGVNGEIIKSQGPKMPQICKTPKQRTVNTATQHNEEMFSQISPGSLSALYQAADSRIDSDLKTDTKDKTDIDNQESMLIDTDSSSIMVQPGKRMNIDILKANSIFHEREHNHDTPENPPNISKSPGDDLFSQISPGVLNAVCEATDLAVQSCDGKPHKQVSAELFTQRQMNITPVRWKKSTLLKSAEPAKREATESINSSLVDQDASGESENRSPKITPVYRYTESSMKSKPQKEADALSESSKSSLSMFRKKTTKFFYPTSSQISKNCPRQIFNLKPSTSADKKHEVNTSLQNVSTLSIDNAATPPGAGGDNEARGTHRSGSAKRKFSHPPFRRYDAEFTSLSSYNASFSDDVSDPPKKHCTPHRKLQYDKKEKEDQEKVQNGYDSCMVASSVDKKNAIYGTTDDIVNNRTKNEQSLSSKTKHQEVVQRQGIQCGQSKVPFFKAIHKTVHNQEYAAVNNLDDRCQIADIDVPLSRNADEKDSNFTNNCIGREKFMRKNENDITLANKESLLLSSSKIDPCSVDNSNDVQNKHDQQMFDLKQSDADIVSERSVCKTGNSEKTFCTTAYMNNNELTTNSFSLNQYIDEPCKIDNLNEYDERKRTIKPDMNGQFQGFQSARGKPVSMSAKSIAKARTLLEKCEDNNEMKDISMEVKTSNKYQYLDALCKTGDWGERKSTIRPCVNVKFGGFHSASEKPVSLSDNSIAKAKTLLEKCEDSDDAKGKSVEMKDAEDSMPQKDQVKTEMHFPIDQPKVTTQFKGFQCASGKAIAVDTQSLSKAHSLLHEMDHITADGNASVTHDSKDTTVGTSYSKTPFIGFQSASGKAISLKEENLAKAKTLFDNLDDPLPISNLREESTKSTTKQDLMMKSLQQNKGKETVDVEFETLTCNPDKATFDGFKSASGSAISLGEKSLQKAQSLMSQISPDNPCDRPGAEFDDHEELTSEEIEEMLGRKGMNKSVKSLKQDPVNMPKKDYSKLPKGFRPFKSPRIVNQNKDEYKSETFTNRTTLSVSGKGNVDNSLNNVEIHKGKEQQVPVRSEHMMENLNTTIGANEFDSFSNTQINEITESTTAFLAMEEDSMGISQFLTSDHSKFDEKASKEVSEVQNSRKDLPCSRNSENQCEQNYFKVEDEKCQDEISGQCFPDVNNVCDSVTSVTTAADEKINSDPVRSIPVLYNTEFNVPIESPLSSNNNEAHVVKENEALNRVEKIVVDETDLGCNDNKNKTCSLNANTVSEAEFLTPEKCLTTDINDHTWSRCSLFQTAGGQSLSFSKRSLKKAQRLLSSDEKDNDNKENMIQQARKQPVVQQCSEMETSFIFEEVMDTSGIAELDASWHGDLDDVAKDQTDSSDRHVEVFDRHITADGAVSKQIIVKKHIREEQQETADRDDTAEMEKSDSKELSVYKMRTNGDPCKYEMLCSKPSNGSISELMPDKVEEFPRKNIVPTDHKGFLSFSTASGKQVNLSAKSLQQARNLLNSEETSEKTKKFTQFCLKSEEENLPSHYAQQNDNLLSEKLFSNRINCQEFSSLSTASGNKVNVFEESPREDVILASAKDSLKDIPTDKPSPFSTASGKTLNISKESYIKAKELLNDAETETVNSNMLTPFATASGNKVTISKKSVEQASTLLHGESVIESKDFDQSCPFSTASGNKVRVSKDSLKLASKVLNEEPTNIENNVMKSSPFSTAAGNDVNVSAKCLHQVKHLLKEKSESENRIDKAKDFSPFSTASGNKVKISESALQKATKMLNEENENITKSYAPFSTAAGNEVNVSKSALQKATKMLNENTKENHNKAKSNAPFSTASGNKVNVSEQSLHEATKLLRRVEANRRSNNKSNDTASDRSYREDCYGETKDKTLEFEASESVRLLLEDGAFDELSPSYDSSASDESLPLTAEKKHKDSHQMIPGICHKAWMKPLNCAPEGVSHDRDFSHNKRLLKPTSTLPPSDSSVDSLAHTRMKKKASDRAIFYERRNHSQTKNQSGDKIVHNKGNFMTPVKKQDKSMKSYGSEEKQTKHNTQKPSFQTPYKMKTPTDNRLAELNNDGQGHQKQQPNELHSQVQRSISTHASGSKLAYIEKPAENVDSGISNKKQPQTKKSKNHKNDLVISDEVKKARLEAKLAQSQRIKLKRCDQVRPETGILYKLKNRSRRTHLRDAVQGALPGFYPDQQLYSHGISDSTLHISASSAENFRFHVCDYYSEHVARHSSSVQVADGALLVIAEDGTIGKEEMYSSLMDLPSVDPKLVSQEWLYNHCRWIVWKLAAMEVAFPNHFGGRVFSPENVMLQLKYRYDREADLAQRPALRKILERDDTPSKSMILCVSDMSSHQQKPLSANIKLTPSKQNSSSKYLLELTDGWYCLKAMVDAGIESLIRQTRIKVGSKIAIFGCELTGSQDACSPLEVPADTMLRLCLNSVRPARWDAPLGFCRHPKPAALPLTSLSCEGGMVGCVDVIITRLYPVQYVEKLPDGSTVVRNEKAEMRASRRFEEQNQKQIEKLYNEIQREFQITCTTGKDKKKRRSCTRLTVRQIEALTTGHQIHEALQAAADPSSIEIRLSGEQVQNLLDYRRARQQSKEDEIRAEMQTRLDELKQTSSRSVSTLLKAHVCGCLTRDIDKNSGALLCIWRPTSSVMDLIREGKRLQIYNLQVGQPRGRHCGEKIQLTAVKTTSYLEKAIDENLQDLIYEPREAASFSELSAGYAGPAYSQLDVVGVVVHVTAEIGDHQMAYLADEDEFLLPVRFWGGLKAFSVDDVMTENTFIAASNLQWRPGGATGLNGTVLATELSVFSTKPKATHLRAALDRLQKQIQDVTSFTEQMKQYCSQTTKLQQNRKPAQQTQPKPPHTPSPLLPRQDKQVSDKQASPMPNNRVDSLSTIINNKSPMSSSSCKTPSSGDERNDENKKTSLKTKVSTLQLYGEPPPLVALSSPLSVSVRRGFKPPGLAAKSAKENSFPPNKRKVKSESVEDRVRLPKDRPESKTRNDGVTNVKLWESQDNDTVFDTSKVRTVNEDILPHESVHNDYSAVSDDKQQSTADDKPSHTKLDDIETCEPQDSSDHVMREVINDQKVVIKESLPIQSECSVNTTPAPSSVVKKKRKRQSADVIDYELLFSEASQTDSQDSYTASDGSQVSTAGRRRSLRLKKPKLH